LREAAEDEWVDDETDGQNECAQKEEADCPC